MFKAAEKTELNQISLTGMRSLVLVGLLMKAPRSLEEIREAFISLNIMEAEHSDDILRIDLNTLRAMGCEITRASAKTDYKYVLLKHPFALHIEREELSLLKKAYKKIKDSASIVTLIKYDELFKKLAVYVTDNDIKEELYGLSVLKNYNVNLIDELQQDCEQKSVLRLIYRNPIEKKETEKEVCAQKLVFQNDKIYLYAYDLRKKESVILNIKRIKSIFSRAIGGENVEIESTCVKFFLKNFGVNEIEENETIVETKDDGCVVEGKYYNKFVAIQRILSFGANCTVLEPQDFKSAVVKKLKDMRKNYNG